MELSNLKVTIKKLVKNLELNQIFWSIGKPLLKLSQFCTFLCISHWHSLLYCFFHSLILQVLIWYFWDEIKNQSIGQQRARRQEDDKWEKTSQWEKSRGFLHNQGLKELLTILSPHCIFNVRAACIICTLHFKGWYCSQLSWSEILQYLFLQLKLREAWPWELSDRAEVGVKK